MFGRQPANRRRPRTEEVLEVRGRTRPARSAALRLLGTLIVLGGGVALAALVAWQVFLRALDHLVYRNPRFAVRSIEVETSGRLDPGQIRQWAGVRPGENLMALSPGRVQASLGWMPWIRDARVERILPDRLVIRVWEREPAARVELPVMEAATARFWVEPLLVDDEGVVLPPLQPGWLRPGQAADFAHLPRLDGLPPDQLRSGRRLESRRVTTALALLRAFEDGPMFPLTDLVSLDTAGSDSFEGRTRDGLVVLFGPADPRRQMLRWRAIHEELAKRGLAAIRIDLSVTNHIPAQLADAPAARPPPPARPARPARARRPPHV